VKPFHGIFTPLVTPLHKDEAPDLSSLARLVEWQIEQGVHGFWAMGTSGEFAAFDAGEREAIVATIVEAARGRVPVIANSSDSSTRLTIRHARAAEAVGATAVAATPPYYYPHSQDELLTHYQRIREAVALPLFIYNIPQTVRVKVELSTAETLAEHGTVAGIKDSQNDLEWLRQLVLFARGSGLQFAVFAGTRHLIDAALLSGADGAIPSVANAFPALCVAVFESASLGDYEAARRHQTMIVEIERAAATFGQGSKNAMVLTALKRLLVDQGVIDSALLTSPLRNATDGAWNEISARIRAVANADEGPPSDLRQEINAPD
jgi:4-hydroxy-tetrahydrodipicolinate synthase